MNPAGALISESMLEEASRLAGGLTDFGDDSFRGGLARMCESLNGEAKLSDTGRYLFWQKFVGQLVNRLRIEDYFKRHPEIAAERVAPPVVIVGLPRTGTTKLHRLLACDPRFYWMAFWESYYPVPFTGESLEHPDQRIAKARGDVDLMVKAMPHLNAIHPMNADLADEEFMLMEHSFLCGLNAYADVPGYMAWLDRQDQTPPYRFLQRTLQFLQWQKRKRGIVAERWVLKAPHHLLRMDTLLRVFPEAKVIQTHRDPVQSIPSIASFIHTLWGIYSDRADPVTAGRDWNDTMKRALEHTMHLREQLPADRFFDVRFKDTVQRPLEVARQVYAFLGLPMSAALEGRMRDWLAEGEKTRHGKHEYPPEKFGLSAEQLQRDFAEYRVKYILNG
ncbi:MAG: sulfotransferase [Nevskia sp.]|nr:sulfotransferase [Nevskia sp.]